MSCTYFRELGSAIVDNEATDAEIKEFNEHILTCDECKTWFETIKILKNETADMRADAPEELKTRVMMGVKNANKKPSFFSRFKFTAVAAAVAIIIFAANGFVGSPPEEVAPDTANKTPMMSRTMPSPDRIAVGEAVETPENIYDRVFSYVIYVKDASVNDVLKDLDFEEKDGYKYYITNMKFDDFSSYGQEIIALNLSLDEDGLVIVKAAD